LIALITADLKYIMQIEMEINWSLIAKEQLHINCHHHRVTPNLTADTTMSSPEHLHELEALHHRPCERVASCQNVHNRTAGPWWNIVSLHWWRKFTVIISSILPYLRIYNSPKPHVALCNRWRQTHQWESAHSRLRTRNIRHRGLVTHGTSGTVVLRVKVAAQTTLNVDIAAAFLVAAMTLACRAVVFSEQTFA
jgi:hypothetical protein